MSKDVVARDWQATDIAFNPVTISNDDVVN